MTRQWALAGRPHRGTRLGRAARYHGLHSSEVGAYIHSYLTVLTFGWDGIESLQSRVGEGLGRQLRGEAKVLHTYGLYCHAVSLDWIGMATTHAPVRIGGIMERDLTLPPHQQAEIHHHRQALPALPCPATPPPPLPEAASLICLPACFARLLLLACLACQLAWLSVSVDDQRANHLVGVPFRWRRSQVDSHLISASWRRCRTPSAMPEWHGPTWIPSQSGHPLLRSGSSRASSPAVGSTRMYVCHHGRSKGFPMPSSPMRPRLA